MQYKSTSTICSCFSLVLQTVMKWILDYFWKPNIPFAWFFSLSTVFGCSTRFNAVVEFWVISMEPFFESTRWWPCWCRQCALACKVYKKLELLEMLESFGPGSRMSIRHCWSKLDTFFSVSLSVIKFGRWLKWFFSSVCQVLRRSSLVLQFHWNVCGRFPKLFSLRMDCFCTFSVGKCFVSLSP